MWSPEGKIEGAANIYENLSEQSLLVTALVHNDEEGDKKVIITVPPSGKDITVRAGKSMAVTAWVEQGRAITCEGKCRFSVVLHRQ